MDNSDEKESEQIAPNRDSPSGILICAACRTSKTPLWRGGPSGPKSLCNACGIRYRKKRRKLLGLKDGVGKEKVKRCNNTSSSNRNNSNKMSVLSMLGFGRDLLLKQRSLLRLKRRRRLAEEEEAAVLLMALSCGLIYA